MAALGEFSLNWGWAPWRPQPSAAIPFLGAPFSALSPPLRGQMNVFHYYLLSAIYYLLYTVYDPLPTICYLLI